MTVNAFFENSTVFVLGAGFSRAISDHMPLTDELGNEIRSRIAEVAAKASRPFGGGYFEAWLSRLAEPQPDLADSVNAANKGLFLTVTDELHKIMIEREARVLAGSPPWWLQRLLGLMHAATSPVITFNYDTLVEQTVRRLGLSDWTGSGVAQPFNLVQDVPPSIHKGGLFAPSEVSTFRLLKLHGSLDIYWVPGDVSGSTINRWDLTGAWGEPQELDEPKRRRTLPGRSPFIVPPAAAKSAFYSNPISRELWRSAAEALGACRRLALVGYSMPPTDLVTSGMLADALVDREAAVDVVNPYPDDIVKRLTALGVDADRITTYPSIDGYTDELEHHAGVVAASGLAGTDGSRPTMVATSQDRAARVTGFTASAHGIRLTIEPVTTAVSTTQPDQDREQPTVAVKALRDSLSPGQTMEVTHDDGSKARIVSSAEWNTDTGLGDGRWCVLIPSAIPGQI